MTQSQTRKITLFRELRERAGLSIESAAEVLGYAPRTIYRWDNGDSTPRPIIVDRLHQMLRGGVGTRQGSFSFIDLFAGIGGMRKGFETAGGRCIFTCEWNKYSRLTYGANFSCDHPVRGDIREVREDEIPRHDMLLAGFPCQPFSIAGVSKKNALGQPHGFLCHTQGTLFFDVARIIARHRPAAFLLENVKNLESHDCGRTFATIMSTLHDELGYRVQVRVIDAAGFVPQHRERVFIVGFRESTNFDLASVSVPAPLDGPRLGSILHPEDGSEPEESPYTVGERARVVSKYTLTRHLWSYLQEYAAKHRAKGNGFGFGLVGNSDVARTLSARYYKDGSEILIRQRKQQPRRLTPRECARLMGFDQAGQPQFNIPVSDTQAYKQFGNAVVVPVISAVASALRPHILEMKNGREWYHISSPANSIAQSQATVV